ncbi:unnamed protein product [Mycena citricolor]|uniref:Protein kinase domain-containing protein n=1 Tax=Mycena citricolor TaxID=2018698 RepID=A0AAD2Q0V5_9AGAR|nr:unnamed protein product [Mycena citricolor]
MEAPVESSYLKLLWDEEQVWVAHQPFLVAHGYQLRPRYRPDWTPSWPADGTPDFRFHEDGLENVKPSTLDAVRLSDGQKVVLKRVETNGNELAMIRYLDSLRHDPRNRTVPVLEILTMEDAPWSFIVMQYARIFIYPPFHCRQEFFEAMRQYFEGLEFMHEHNVVHFDIAIQNMTMEESLIVPRGSHFWDQRTHTGNYGWFRWRDRCSVTEPINYYYIDFGLSLYFPDGTATAQHTALLRTFPDCPELSLTKPYNPFRVDVYQLGLAMRKAIKDYPDLQAFRPLADEMMKEDPESRPSPSEALASLHKIAESIPPAEFRARIWKRKTSIWKKLCRWIFGGYYRDYAFLEDDFALYGKY